MCPVAFSQYLGNSLEGNVIFNMSFRLDCSAFLVRESIAKIVINF